MNRDSFLCRNHKKCIVARLGDSHAILYSDGEFVSWYRGEPGDSFGFFFRYPLPCGIAFWGE